MRLGFQVRDCADVGVSVSGQSMKANAMSWPLSRRTVLVGAALAAVSRANFAQADAPFGPKVGSKAPDLGVLQDQTGKGRRLRDLAGSKGVVLVFFRSADWCPFCQAQLMAINADAAEIEARGYKIVGLSYDAPAVTRTFTDRRAIRYVLLSDPKAEVINRWGLRDPQYPVGHRAFGVPRPAIFVLDRKGVIRASLAEETYQKRPPVTEIVKALDAIQ